MYIWNILQTTLILYVYTHACLQQNKSYSVGRRKVELRELYQVLLSDKTMPC